MDPLSVSASAAGLTSLGLTISGGLIQYCKSYQGRDADLSQLTRHAQKLESFLSMVDNRTASPGQDIDNSLQGCRDACNACLRDFKRLNAKYTHSRSSQTFKERSRKLAHDLRYPFDKGKMEYFRSQLQDFYIELLGYLQLIHLDITRDMRSKVTLTLDSVGRQVQSSSTNIEQVVTDLVHDNTDRLETSFLHGFQETMDNMKTSLDRNLGAMSTQVAILSQDQTSQTLVVKDHVDQALELQCKKLLELFTQAQASSSQSQNYTSTAVIGSDQRVELKTSPDMPAQNIFDSLCKCPGMSQERRNMRHRKGCIYSFNSGKKWDFTVRFRLLHRRITMKWQSEYHPMTWTMYPSLTIRATVPDDSPAFEAVRVAFTRINASLSHGAQVDGILRDCLFELRNIFENGKGWPTDVLKGESNLLHRTLYYTSIEYRPEWSEELANVLINFIDA
ncbi:hypothetical protein F5B20DRAFT_92881 [Whalleya microplaca]|nr:hypothetical protein F5B20DRAFT_92881 [Whalleya microplaca]